MEVLIAIAMLCSTQPISITDKNYNQARTDQLECQKYYIKCTGEKNQYSIITRKNLKQCILKRTIK